jgi:DNA-binding MarR family transcriptional regulator
MAQASVPQQWVPESREDELAAGLGRLARRLRSIHRDAPAIACLSIAMQAGPIRVSSLADELGVDTSTVSRLVSQLVASRLLARTPDPADQRAWLLTVTSDGIAHVRQGMLKRSRVLRAATTGWSSADVTTLTKLINRLAEDLAAIEG